MAKKNMMTAIAASLISLPLFLSGCSESTVSNTANASNANQAVVVSNNSAAINTNAAANVPAANAGNISAANMPNSNASGDNRKPAQATKEPTPQYGSGANDLMMFTKLRNSLSADKDLQTYVVIDVKEGNVTLSGKAASAEKKAQAEQLIKAVEGVKSVKNNITVSK